MLTKPQDFYEFGAFRLDVREQVLFAGSEPVQLTPKAFQTLLLLIQNSGRTVSKDELLLQVWAETFVAENTLSFNISSLRKTLARFDQSTVYIETVPRRGFRFAVAVRATEASVDKIILEHSSRSIASTVTEAAAPEAEEQNIIEPPKKLLLAEVPKRFVKFWTVGTSAAVLALVLLGSVATIYFWRGERTAVETSVPQNQSNAAEIKPGAVRSIAVLPLRSLGDSKTDKEFRLQITDALITNLGNLPTVAVRPTSAVMRYAEAPTDALVAGRSLEVDAVLDGSLQRDEQNLRLTLQLVSTATGAQLWARQFDQTFSNVFALQDAVSAQVVKTLTTEFARRANEQPQQRPTENAAAYEAYLRGRFYWNQRTEKDFVRSLEFFEQAIALDPKFADGYAGLADAHLGFYDYAFRSPQETVPLAKKALNKALQLNPNLSDAHTSLAFIEFIYDWNAEKAFQSSQKAVELNPNNSLAYHRYGWFLMIAGKDQEGLRQLERALELDPLSSTIQTNIGYAHFCARRYEQAIEQFKKVIANDQSNSLPHWYLGASFHSLEQFDEMITAYVKALELDGNFDLAEKVKNAQRAKGIAAAFNVWNGELEKQSRKKYVPAYNLAFTSALLKDREKTFANLKKAFELHDPWLVQVTHDPEFDFVRDDPRFREFVPFSR